MNRHIFYLTKLVILFVKQNNSECTDNRSASGVYSKTTIVLMSIIPVMLMMIGEAAGGLAG